jgi:hypothetical protein
MNYAAAIESQALYTVILVVSKKNDSIDIEEAIIVET